MHEWKCPKCGNELLYTEVEKEGHTVKVSDPSLFEQMGAVTGCCGYHDSGGCGYTGPIGEFKSFPNDPIATSAEQGVIHPDPVKDESETEPTEPTPETPSEQSADPASD